MQHANITDNDVKDYTDLQNKFFFIILNQIRCFL